MHLNQLGCSIVLAISVLTACAATFISHRETVQEAAYHARDLINRRSDGLATFMSVFPQGYGDGLDGLPIGGMEYVAPASDGDLYILAMPLSKVSLCLLGVLLLISPPRDPAFQDNLRANRPAQAAAT
jgi:hypothetical protein